MSQPSSHYRALVGACFLTFCTAFLWASESDEQHENQKEAPQANATEGSQKVCPVRKGDIDPEVFIEYQGQRIYFCCPGCDGKFSKDPEKYFGEMEERGELARNIQTLCPVSGDALDQDKVALTLPGRQIFFCCENCVGKFKKNPKAYEKNLSRKADDEKGEHTQHQGHDHSGHHH